MTAADNTARLWDADTGKSLGEMIHQDIIWSARFSPDGTRVVTASGNAARLWDSHNGKPMSETMTQESRISRAQFSPDSTRVVTASSQDGTARLWDATTANS